MLGGRRHAARPGAPSAKGTAVAATRAGGRAEAAIGFGDRRRRGGRRRGRREVDVDRRRRAGWRRCAALRAAEGGDRGRPSRAPRRSAHRRSASPAHPPGRPSPAAGRAGPAGGGIACRPRDQAPAGGAARGGFRRRGSPRRRSPARIIRLDRGRRLGAGEADDDPLHRRAGRGSAAGGARPRRGAVAERHAEGEGADRKARRAAADRDSPAPPRRCCHARRPYEPRPRASGASPSLAPGCRP